MIKNIVFDIGNVLMSFQPMRAFQHIAHHETLCPLLFRSQLWLDYDRGTCTLDELRARCTDAFPQHRQSIMAMLENWPQILQPIQPMTAFRQECKDHGYGIYIISNLNEDSARFMQERYALFDGLDGAILSYQEHLLKPDPQMFSLLLTRYALRPETCLFLDDSPDNVNAACRIGMRAVRVDDPAAAIKEARELLC